LPDLQENGASIIFRIRVFPHAVWEKKWINNSEAHAKTILKEDTGKRCHFPQQGFVEGKACKIDGLYFKLQKIAFELSMKLTLSPIRRSGYHYH
jgi:hypothetical protein